MLRLNRLRETSNLDFNRFLCLSQYALPFRKTCQSIRNFLKRTQEVLQPSTFELKGQSASLSSKNRPRSRFSLPFWSCSNLLFDVLAGQLSTCEIHGSKHVAMLRLDSSPDIDGEGSRAQFNLVLPTSEPNAWQELLFTVTNPA